MEQSWLGHKWIKLISLLLLKIQRQIFRTLLRNNCQFIRMRHALGFVWACRQFNSISSNYLVSIKRTGLIKHLQEAAKHWESYNQLGQLTAHALLYRVLPFPGDPFDSKVTDSLWTHCPSCLPCHQSTVYSFLKAKEYSPHRQHSRHWPGSSLLCFPRILYSSLIMEALPWTWGVGLSLALDELRKGRDPPIISIISPAALKHRASHTATTQ